MVKRSKNMERKDIQRKGKAGRERGNGEADRKKAEKMTIFFDLPELV